MQRSRLRLAVYASAAVLAVGGGAVAAFAATGGSTAAATGLNAVFSKDSDWGTGYQGRYTITNNTGATVNGWQLVFGLPMTAKLGSFWDATVTTANSATGFTETAKNPSYATTIAPGATAVFGFVVAGSGAPTSCVINGASCTGGGTATTAPTTAPTTTTPTKAPTTAPTTTAPTTAPTTKAPTTSPTTAAPTTSAPSSSSGNVLVAPYVDMGVLSNGSTTLAQLGASGNLKSFSLAFVTSVGCKASWFNAFDPRAKQFADQIAAVRAAGGDVKISFGGATGIELADACTSVASLQAEYQAVVTAYNLKYVDFDIEGAAVAEPASIARRSAAIAGLQKANPGLKVSLTLPVLPEGLTADGLNVVQSAKNAGVSLDLVNIMAMDYGRAGQDYGDLAIQAVTATKNQIKSIYGNSDAAAFKMVGVTPMIGVNDDNGTFGLDDAKDLVAFANTNHIGFMSFWEEGRDANACNGALFQCTNISQAKFAFSKIFAGFTG